MTLNQHLMNLQQKIICRFQFNVKGDALCKLH